jgi:hypothetical protein
MPDGRLAVARRLLDRAALALALGAAAGRFRLELPCRGRHLLEPTRTYVGRWEDVAGDVPPHPAVRALAATWPAEDAAAYAAAAFYLDQIDDRVAHTGLFGRFVVELYGDAGVLRVGRLAVEEDFRPGEPLHAAAAAG